MAIPILKPSTDSGSGKGSSSSNVAMIVTWRILPSILLLVIVRSALFKQSPALPQQQQQRQQQLQSNIRTKSSNSNVHLYTSPISNRVPAQGIETVLATSSTDPPFHFFIHAKHNDFIAESIIKTGIYEADSTTAVIDAIVCSEAKKANSENQKPLLVLDVGANIGFHSLHMASCGARVVSFEASPDTAWLLTSSAKLNDMLRNQGPTPEESNTITLIPRGVSNVTGTTARMSRHPKSPGMTTFATNLKDTPSGWDLQSGADGTALDVDIPLIKAQEALQEMQITPETYNLRFLKVDVEGFEKQALQGLDLSKYPVEYLTFEFFPTLLRAGGTDPVDLLVYVWKQGYDYLEIPSAEAATTTRIEDYKPIEMGGGGGGSTTEEHVQSWAQGIVQNGEKKKKKNFHINLLARRRQV